MAIYKEMVTVIASDLENTTWSELYELWLKAAQFNESPAITAELNRLIQQTKLLHDDILKLAKYYSPEIEY